MRGVENDARARAAEFDDDILHLQIAKDRRAMEIVLLHGATVALQLTDDVGLRVVNSLGCRRPWPNLHEIFHMLISPRSIEIGCVPGGIRRKTRS